MDMNMLDVKDRVTQYSDLYKLVPVDPEQNLYQLVQVPGTVTEEGTPINRGLFESIRTDLRVPSTVLGYAVSIQYEGINRLNQSGSSTEQYCTATSISSNMPGVDSETIVVPDNCRHILVTFMARGEATTFGNANFYLHVNKVSKHEMFQYGDVSFSSADMLQWSDSAIIEVTPGDTVELYAKLSGDSDERVSVQYILMQVSFIR